MRINVRVNGVLAQKMGMTRFPVSLPPQATVQILVEQLLQSYPQFAGEIGRAVAVRGGSHQPPTAELADGEEIALLLPIAGG